MNRLLKQYILGFIALSYGATIQTVLADTATPARPSVGKKQKTSKAVAKKETATPVVAQEKAQELVIANPPVETSVLVPVKKEHKEPVINQEEPKTTELDDLVIQYSKLDKAVSQQDLIQHKLLLINTVISGTAASIAQTVRYMNVVCKKSSVMKYFDSNRVQAELIKIQSLFEEYILQFSDKELITKNPDAYLLTLIQRTLQVSNYTIAYLFDLLNNNFSKAPIYDFYKYAKSHTAPQVTVKYIEQTMYKTKQLEAAMASFGLTKKNRFFRWTQDNIIDPTQRFLYKYPITSLVSASALFGTYMLWKKGKINSLLGEFPKISTPIVAGPNGFVPGEPVLDNEKMVGKAGQLYWFLRELSADQYAMMLAGGVLASATTTITNTKNLVQQKFQQWYNSMRGFLHEEQGVAGMFDFNPRHTINDVIGCDHVKDRMNTVLKAIENPVAFAAASEKRALLYLFTGGSRSGKTFMAEAVCGSIRAINPACQFWVIEYRDVMQFGVDGIIARAKYYAPVVIIFDEAHLLQLQETGNKELLKQFLSSVGNTNDNDPTKPIVIMALSNHEEHIDTALKNRFEVLRFEYPTLEERAVFLIKELSKYALDPARFDIMGMAQKTEQKSFAQLSRIINNGINKAWIQGSLVTQDLFDNALDVITRNVIPNSYLSINNAAVLEEIATYFVGQAVMTSLLQTNRPLDIVTINKIQHEIAEAFTWTRDSRVKNPADEYGYLFRRNTQETRGIATTQEIENNIKILLAGRVALRITQGKDNHLLHKHDDMEAFELIKKLTTPHIEVVGDQIKNKLEAETYEHFVAYQKEVESLLTRHKDRLPLLAKILARMGTLAENELAQLMQIELPELAHIIEQMEKAQQ